jgi:hypothetical protein
MHAVTARTELQPRGFHGWALKVACRLDGAHPVLAHICQTGSLKRQAIFAVLSELARDSPETLADRMRAVIPQPVTYTADPLAVIARALVVARPSALLKSLFGSVPNGLLGVMRRLATIPSAILRATALSTNSWLTRLTGSARRCSSRLGVL